MVLEPRHIVIVHVTLSEKNVYSRSMRKGFIIGEFYKFDFSCACKMTQITSLTNDIMSLSDVSEIDLMISA